MLASSFHPSTAKPPTANQVMSAALTAGVPSELMWQLDDDVQSGRLSPAQALDNIAAMKQVILTAEGRGMENVQNVLSDLARATPAERGRISAAFGQRAEQALLRKISFACQQGGLPAQTASRIVDDVEQGRLTESQAMAQIRSMANGRV